MAVASSFGVIFYLSVHSGQPCELVFRDMARAAGFKTQDLMEVAQLKEFAEASCQTSNPDILWQLAYQESSFRFSLVRENIRPGLANIYEGNAAPAFLKNLTQFDRNRNIDIGVMQFNWAWHHDGFQNEPLKVLTPRAQVHYFLKSFSGEIFDRCHGRWVGCYHTTNDKSRAQKYEQDVLEKGRILRLHALRYLRKVRGDLTLSTRESLPPIRQDDVDRLLEFAREVPIPQERK
ncbi:MAG: hypothetical protein EOP10_14745 [Proteobacteria bacterium]|nr:MAG: hypothetical protein EOP10_14745 [Pseudomonadota bacterium]